MPVAEHVRSLQVMRWLLLVMGLAACDGSLSTPPDDAGDAGDDAANACVEDTEGPRLDVCRRVWPGYNHAYACDAGPYPCAKVSQAEGWCCP